jgi:integrase
VPLAARALALLKSLYTEDGACVFVGARPGQSIGHAQMRCVLRGLEPMATVHGFRSAFSDWAHALTAYAPHVIELCLAHSIGSAVAQAYRRAIYSRNVVVS